MIRYEGDATIKQGDAELAGLCFVEWSDDGATWNGRLQSPAPEFNLVEGKEVWLVLDDGRECAIMVDENVAGSGLVVFSNPRGDQDLR